jgi:hypothetical protein
MTACSTAFAVAVLSTIVVGCGSFDRPDAKALVQRVGEGRILSAAESLRPSASANATSRTCHPVARDAWPEPIRQLDPESVCVDSDGVFIRKHGFFVQEEGIYLVFEASEPPEEGSGDPSFRQVFNRIYWYQFRG